MTLITTVGPYGLVLDGEDAAGRGPGASASRFDSAGRIPQHAGHFVLLNRYKVDDGGYICLTPSLPLRDLYGSVDLFATELRSLLEQAERKFSSGIAAEPIPTDKLPAV